MMYRERPRLSGGQRIYAVGDLHGRLDLFTELVAKIRVDATRQPARVTKLVLLGDLIDRGPDSQAIVTHVQQLAQQSTNLIVLRGNHEQVMVQALGGDRRAFEAWVKMGGLPTLRSWGLGDTVLSGPVADLLTAARRAIPKSVIDWMGRLPLFYKSGSVLFVHAGIRPEVPLREQNPVDYMWIRSDFTTSNVAHPAMIVHGHTICEHGPEILWNRINVDTGAYRTGRLSAVGLQGSRQWTLTTTGSLGTDYRS